MKKTVSSDDLRSELFERLTDEVFSKPQLHQPASIPIDIQSALQESLAHPLHYPALAESVFAGDRVAIALQNGLPQPRPILTGILRQLWSSNIDPLDVVVVVTERTARDLGFSKDQRTQQVELDGSGQPVTHMMRIDEVPINFEIHHGDVEAGLSYLVANKAGDAVHVNRKLVDADVILPVGCPTAGGRDRQTDCLYPDFGSAAVHERFRNQDWTSAASQQEIELANNTLGSFFTIQVVAGPGNAVCKIISGTRADAIETAISETNRLWEFDSPIEQQIAVGTIETMPEDQTWEDFAQAVMTASQVTSSEAPIIIWSEIGEPPNRRVRKALLSQFEEGISSGLSSDLKLMAAIISERPIYIKSSLSRNTIEDLGLGFIESVDEVARLVEPFQSGILLRDAHKCQPRVVAVD